MNVGEVAGTRCLAAESLIYNYLNGQCGMSDGLDKRSWCPELMK
jgi:hypothetical protein